MKNQWAIIANTTWWVKYSGILTGLDCSIAKNFQAILSIVHLLPNNSLPFKIPVQGCRPLGKCFFLERCHMQDRLKQNATGGWKLKSFPQWRPGDFGRCWGRKMTIWVHWALKQEPYICICEINYVKASDFPAGQAAGKSLFLLTKVATCLWTSFHYRPYVLCWVHS